MEIKKYFFDEIRGIVDNQMLQKVVYVPLFSKTHWYFLKMNDSKYVVNVVIELKVSIGFGKGRVNRTCQFFIVEVEYTFQGIFRRLFIHRIKVVPFSYQQYMRCLVNGIIATYKGCC